jgi:hypothetical protein
VSNREAWRATVDRMLTELRRGDARSETYWAQQLAFGPVFVHAVALRWRSKSIPTADVPGLTRCLQLAHSAFAALPELDGGDPTALRLLAARQARAIGWGRRGSLAALLARLGASPMVANSAVPSRMVRPYELLGFRPHERLAG